MKNLLARIRAIKPNRVAVYLTTAAGLATAVAPAVADLDTTSAGSLAVGFAGIVLVVDRFLKGWQAHEERQADPHYEV